MDTMVDKLSIKNILFTKAIPSHEIPPYIPAKGYKVYPCTDCGDKFLFETNYEGHVNRKSMLITYMCRHCAATKIFYNRCKLLQHIRSHPFKTATINVNDLKVEAVPIGLYKSPTPAGRAVQSNATATEISHKTIKTACMECKTLLNTTGVLSKDRAAHWMQATNETYSCPVCLFTLPTICAIKTHLRFHLKCPPYCCPECGVNILNKNIYYPFNHGCEGFNMMRATARVKCPVEQCQLLHPYEFKDHMKERHVKKVFKCPICVVACFNEPTMHAHLTAHHNTNNQTAKALIFYQCELCPGRLVLQNHIDNHLKTHANTDVFPCWSCGMVFKTVFTLLKHHLDSHSPMHPAMKTMLSCLIYEYDESNGNQREKPKRFYRVVKRCDRCKRNFTYKCKYNEIPVLPNECPFKCSSKNKPDGTESKESHIVCHMCNVKVPYNWPDIKKHYSEAHKDYQCLDPKVIVKRIDVQKYLRKNEKKLIRRVKKKKHHVRLSSTNELNDVIQKKISISTNQCCMCDHISDSKELLEAHFRSHQDPCMAYQCLECGQSFVVKPSFSKHLMLVHGINDVEQYITSKECYNENALDKQQKRDLPTTPPKENQCTICMDQFENAEDLEKHFRVHGMAFLLKNTAKDSKTAT